MKNGGIRRVILGAIFLAAATALVAADHYKVLNGPKDFYFGHISLVEDGTEGAGPTVLREGSAVPEPGVLNLPIGPGDTIRTSGGRRCEIQFDTGTIVRLDTATELRVETILARSLSSLDGLSVLSLAKGRIYLMYKEYNSREMFQVLTANTAVKLRRNAVAYISFTPDGTTETQVKYGRAQVLFGPAENKLEDRSVKKGERLVVLADHRSQLAEAVEGTAFELWNKDVNAHFEDLHEGLTALPKPLQKLPEAVFYFAQTYGNTYGEWLWDDLFGYVWHPYIDNGRYPWGWSPYHYGFWSYTGGQMFWVPQEPWGWVPYHLGIWHWDKKRGWFWLPGSLFAPAWVDWDFYFGYASWRPWNVFDWMFGDPYMYGSDPNWITYFRWEQARWMYFWPPPSVSPSGGGAPGGPTLIRRDMLKQPPGGLPVPPEFKALVKKAADAYERGDARIRESAAEVPRSLVFVAKDDLRSRSVSEKALTWDEVPKRGAPTAGEKSVPPGIKDPAREAGRIFRRLDAPAGPPRRTPNAGAATIRSDGLIAVPVVAADPVAPAGSTAPGVRLRGNRENPSGAGSAAARFRDWNPDLRVARELGVHIEYSSMRNEVRCPELRLSSSDRVRTSGLTPRMTSRGVSFGPATSVGGGQAGGSSSSGSVAPGPSSGTTQPARTSSGSGGRESKGSGTSAGGKIKN
jgi:hypothetical protein